jgi:biotin carboxylase
MKPPAAKGSRGFRVLSGSVDRRHALLEARPGPLPLSVDEALEAIGPDDFPPLLVMELVTGPEHTVDGICRDGRLVLGHAKTREAMRAGLAMWFETVDRPDFVDAADRLARELGLDWLVNVQFIGDRLLEINPRISTIVYQEDLNLPYLAVRHAVGEVSADELASLVTRVRSTRRALRYYDQVEWDEPQ